MHVALRRLSLIEAAAPASMCALRPGSTRLSAADALPAGVSLASATRCGEQLCRGAEVVLLERCERNTARGSVQAARTSFRLSRL